MNARCVERAFERKRKRKRRRKCVTGSWVTYSILDGTVDDVTFALVLP